MKVFFQFCHGISVSMHHLYACEAKPKSLNASFFPAKSMIWFLALVLPYKGSVRPALPSRNIMQAMYDI
jgi:hypothetical protein